LDIGRPMKPEQHFRKPTSEERALLEHLLQADFPGRHELASIMRDILVRTLDEYDGLEIRSQVEGKAPIMKRIPVEAEAKDDDGFTIHVLLHVVDGRPVELEIYKDDGSRVKRKPSPSEFELIVLPPAPSSR
jgi:hypothetical protein